MRRTRWCMGWAALLVAAAPPQGANMVFQQAAADGLVVMEAENFASSVSTPTHAWVAAASPPAGTSGAGMMEASPNNGTSYGTIAADFVANSPRLDFRVHFVATGDHYLWVRGYSTNQADNSIHIGLDGVASDTSDRIDFPNVNVLDWSNVRTSSSPAPRINIPTTGVHTINVWMREDGVLIDKILLTTNSAYPAPTGAGPAESSRTSDPSPAAPSNLAAAAASDTRIDLTWTDNASNESGFQGQRKTANGLAVSPVTYNGANTAPTVEAAGAANSFRPGALVVNDRTDYWTVVPEILSGSARLLTARNDRQVAPTDSKYVVSVSRACTIYLPLDPRYGGAPTAWMDATWTGSGMTCNSNARGGWKIWQKTIPGAGNVTLGCDTLQYDGACYVFAESVWAPFANPGADAVSWADTGLAALTTYAYRLRATNAFGDSAWSNVASATTLAAGGGPPPPPPPPGGGPAPSGGSDNDNGDGCGNCGLLGAEVLVAWLLLGLYLRFRN